MPGIGDPWIAGSLVRPPIAMHPVAMDTKNLGTLGTTSAIGLGLMAMSDAYGPSDRAESVATIHAALDAGIIMLDTGDFYGMGHNELLLEEALRGRDRNGVQISVKFGGAARPARRVSRVRRPPRRGEDVAGLLTATAWHRPHRRLPAGAP